MMITHKLAIDLARREIIPQVDTMQNDANSRVLELSLLENRTPWEIPADVTAALNYIKPDGTNGLYDTLPDGSTAYVISGNTITIHLVPQILTVPGLVRAAVILTRGTAQITTFPLSIHIKAIPGKGADKSENYYHYSNFDELNAAIGDLAKLNTGNKSSLVGALNEIASEAGKSAVMSVNGIKPDGNGNVQIVSTESSAAPSITVEETPDGTIICITDVQGSSNAFIPNGKEGPAPVKGIDYWTETDKAEITAEANMLISEDLAKRGQLKPEFADTIDNCTDKNKLYVLPDGNIYAYRMAGATEEVIAYTNRLPLAVDSDGNAYNGGKGWKADTRLNSSGAEVSQPGIACTGFIPVKRGDILRFRNFGFIPNSDVKNYQYTAIYDSNKTKLDAFISTAIQGNYGINDINGVAYDDAGNMILLRTDALDLSQPYTFPENTAFVRFSAKEITDDTIITVNEEIKTTTVTTDREGWANTGHAFVPADYESRIIGAEEAIEAHEARLSNMENHSAAGMPDYVAAEAESVMDRVIEAQGTRTFTLAAITDMHYGNASYTDGLVHTCQAMRYLDSRIKLDAVSVLGDYTDGFTGTGYDNAIGDFKAINAELSSLRFAPNLRVHGNHDHYEIHSPILHRYITAYSDDVVRGSQLGGYFYRDFEDYQLRIICLNTAEENVDGLSCSAEQYSWFAGALDLSGKENAAQWQTLILSHHPLDWFISNNSGYVFWQILNAYLNGTTWNGIDFAGKNAAIIIGNIHGHIHNLLTRKIAAGQPNTTANTVNVVRMATPEACYGRANSYHDSWDYNPFGENTSYPKTKGTAEDTAFCIYCIDLDTHTIKAICYGAGYDREISY